MLSVNDKYSDFNDQDVDDRDASHRMISDWTAENSAKFQKEITMFGHNLQETGLFSDEALINLLERHPVDRTGDFRNASGETLLKAAKAGAIWINLRQAMNVHEDYKDVLDAMYGELAEKTGNKAFNPKGGILISSPVAKVPYHFDKTETLLWHVRGKKRMYIYPLTQEFISDENYEMTLTNSIEDDIPYDVSYDEHATVVDIPENTALAWRLNAPHRVDNQTFCVSVTTEYSTAESGMKNAAMLANATLRYRLGLNPSYEADSTLKRKVKSIMGRAISKAGFAPNTTQPDMVTFKIDKSVDNYIVDVEPFLRTF